MMVSMQQLPLDFTRIGRCDACGQRGVLNARICRACENSHGRRIAELLARCAREPEFARSCFLRLTAAQRRDFVGLVGPGALLALGPGLSKCPAKPAPLRVVGNHG